MASSQVSMSTSSEDKSASTARPRSKGSAISMMVELLAGAMIGEFLSIESVEDDAGRGGPPKGGELIMALDPAKFGDPDGFLVHGEKLFEAILAQEGTRLPGARRFENRQKTVATGIEIPQSLHQSILDLM